MSQNHSEDDHRGSLTFDTLSVDPSDPNFAERVRPVAECYREVYGNDSAWQEGKLCRSCTTPGRFKKWRLADAPTACPVCGKPLTDFWPVEGIIEDMRTELALPDAVYVVARLNSRVIGGALGYSATPEELEGHLNHEVDPKVQVRGVPDELRRRFPGVDRFAYQDEIFIHPDFQRRGFGRRVFYRRHEALVRADLNVYVFRTMSNPPSKTYLWMHDNWGYEVIARYPDMDERVVLTRHFSKIPEER